MKVADVKEIQKMDREAIQRYGICDILLMENAGIAVSQVISENYPIRQKRFLIFCGSGNNGGDGLVLARKLHSGGADIRLFILDTPNKFKGIALKNWQIIQKLDLPILVKPTIEQLKTFTDKEAILVDGIFGTGLTRKITGYYYQIIQWINQNNSPVISIDIPSGIDGDNGSIKGIAIRADHTITFGLPKLGNLFYPGYDYCGRLHVSHISFPPSLYMNPELKTQINDSLSIPPRSIAGHKGAFGNVLFVAGTRNYYGAPYLSSLSFLKSGGGYSRLAAPASIIPYISTNACEVVFLPQKETLTGSISGENFSEILKCSQQMDMVVLGPGLSLDKETQSLARRLIAEIDKPLLVDGDGLTALSQEVFLLKKRKLPTILTPHLGELSHLTGQSLEKIKEDPISLMQDFCQQFHSILVMKGAHTMIGLPNGQIFINMTGNSGMATAGSGDVLTGTIAAMFSLGLPIESAVREGVLIHGFAGDLAAEQKGKDGITARDILEALPKAMKIVRDNQNLSEKLNFTGLEIIS